MTIDKLILLVIDSAGGCLKGKTLLQKRVYFLGQLLKRDFDFKAHFYGPYSAEVEEGLLQDKSRGLVEEHEVAFGVANRKGFEVRRYDYMLNEDGKEVVEALEAANPSGVAAVRDALARLERAGDSGDYISLSVAAKAFHILRSQGRPLTFDEICAEGGRIGWRMQPDSVDRAADMLEKLDLIRMKA
jgi:uncharacterized protein